MYKLFLKKWEKNSFVVVSIPTTAGILFPATEAILRSYVMWVTLSAGNIIKVGLHGLEHVPFCS